ncbi:MAG: TolC family protein [Candidatus Eremiobacteraeota bacterium]|nr:TolC family protein [Candidatus Eremiobacteraeota bacterium]
MTENTLSSCNARLSPARKLVNVVRVITFFLFIIAAMAFLAGAPSVSAQQDPSPQPLPSAQPKKPPESRLDTAPITVPSIKPPPVPGGPARPLTLAECLSLAIENRPDLKSAEDQIKAAQAVVGETMSAYYPQISFTSSWQRSGGPDRVSSTSSSSLGNITGINTYNTIVNTTVSTVGTNYTDSLTLSQYITDFGKTPYLVTASQQSYVMTLFDLITLKNTIINSVKKSYYNCIAAQELLKAKQENVAVLEIHLRQSQAFYDTGRKSKIEVTKSEVDLAAARLDMINADNGYKVTLVTLVNAMGFDRPFSFELARDLTLPEVPLGLDQVKSVAAIQRPELLKLDAQIRGQQAKLSAAKADFYPEIVGNAQYNWRGNKYPLDRYWQLGVTLAVPITDGNWMVYRVRENLAQLDSLVKQKDRLWQNIALEIEQAYLAIIAAGEKIKVSQKSLQQAEENFRLAQGRYAVGVGSNLEYSDAQVLLLQAKTDYITALVQYFNAVADLEKSMGVDLSAAKAGKK